MREARSRVVQRLDSRGLARLISLAGCLLLLAALFFPWYELAPIDVVGGPSERPSGWESFRYADVLLAGMAAAGALLCLAEPMARARSPWLGVALIGWLAAAVIVYSYFRPVIAGPLPAAPGPPAIGYFIALCATGGMVVGGLWAGLSARR